MSSGRRSSMTRPRDQTRLKIERMEVEREERRRAMQERKQERAEEEQRNIAAGIPGDVDFVGLVGDWREANKDRAQPHSPSPQNQRICVCVRKRPTSDKERQKNDHDSITCLHPFVWVHSSKFRVDGITKFLDNNSFKYDHAFDESVSTEDVYRLSTMKHVDFVCGGTGGIATVFAFGQTGSGKTFTMEGIQQLVSEDFFLLLSKEHGVDGGCSLDDTTVTVAFFEIYGSIIQDLLNRRERLKILEDGKGEIVVSGLQEFEANSPSEFLALLESGNQIRTTHATEANDTSSRSHAICQIMLRDKATSRLRGKLSLVDLAGSERGMDTKSHNSKRRTESADINSSLLALKECIRALEMNKTGTKHVSYRASKLTLILKDCFTSKAARTTMIATVSPGASSADHTLNTLRYADRIKENKVGNKSSTATSGTRTPPRKEKSIPSSSLSQNRVSETANGTQGDLDGGASSLDAKEPAEEEESEADKLRRAMEVMVEEEENVLNSHMSMIHENAKLLTEEGEMIQAVQALDASNEDVDQYASRLASILDRKTQMIAVLQEKMANLQAQQSKNDDMANKMEKRSHP